MECLRNYIGIKSCGFAPSDSGMYINSLPGVEFANIDQIANPDQQNYAGVWADVQDRAVLRFREDVLGMISGFDRKYKLKQIAQTVDLGKQITQVLTPALATKRGHTIELNEIGAQCVCSNMQTIYIQAVQIYLGVQKDINLFITDIDLQQVLLTKTILLADTVVGWNVFKIDQEFEVSRLSVTYDVTNIDAITLDLSNFILGDVFTSPDQVCSSCGWNGTGMWFEWGCSCVAICQGIQSTSGAEVYGSNTFGVSTLYSIRCTYNNIVCKNKKAFASAFRWCLGIELMTERIYTSRINKWTTVDYKKATELRSEYEIQYRGGALKDGGLIEGSLKTIIYGIDLNLSDCCLTADAPIRFAEPML